MPVGNVCKWNPARCGPVGLSHRNHAVGIGEHCTQGPGEVAGIARIEREGLESFVAHDLGEVADVGQYHRTPV